MPAEATDIPGLNRTLTMSHQHLLQTREQPGNLAGGSPEASSCHLADIYHVMREVPFRPLIMHRPRSLGMIQGLMPAGRA